MLRPIVLFAALLFPVASAAQSPATPPSSSTPAPAQPAAASPTDAQLIALGRQLTTWMYEGQLDSIRAHMAEETRARIEKDRMQQDYLEILARIGGETEVILDKMTLRKGNRQYWRESKVENFTDDTIVLRWVFNPQGEVIGLGVSPTAKAPAPE